MLFLYNSLSGHKTEFIPLLPDHVGMYVCGPTVYDRMHLGNARCMLAFDMLYRVLRLIYPSVTYVRNITDVDDKINAAAKTHGVTIGKWTEKTIEWFHQDASALGLLDPTHEPKATDWILAMVDMIADMIGKKLAYVSGEHVLFDVSESPHYGQLSKMPLDQMKIGARVESAEYKHDPLDFVLWKPSADDEPGWASPWGRGRPGWHIECSAMSTHYLGSMMDIHGGGRDLMFPHHENERAQTCACSGELDCAQCWMHTGMLVVNGQKMSKSLGNFITLHDGLKAQPAEVLRWALLTSHYRHALDWTDRVLDQARTSVDGIYRALDRSQAATGRDYSLVDSAHVEDLDSRYWLALCDDLNTPFALNRLQQMARLLHKNPLDEDLAQRLYNSAKVFGLIITDIDTWFQPKNLPMSKEEIESLIVQRQQARASKDFARADLIRAQLLEKGIALEDKGVETSWRIT